MGVIGKALAALRAPRRAAPAREVASGAPAVGPLPPAADTVDRNDDRALVLAITSGSQAAFEALVAEHQRTCARVLRRMVHDPAQVDDLLQETFLAAYRQLHRFRFESSLRTWLSRVAYTTALQYLRRRRQEAQWLQLGADDDALEIDDERPGPLALSEAWQASDQLQRAIARLSPAQRLVVELHYGEEFDISEIVQITGFASGTIKSHLHRARHALKAGLQRPGPAGALR